MAYADGPRRLLTVLSAGVGYAGDTPFAAVADKVEEVGSAVVDLPVAQKLKRGPDHGEVVVDPDEGIVDALLDLRRSGAADAFGEGVDGHLGRLSVAHEDQDTTGEPRLLDRGGVALCHAVEHGLHGGEDGLLFGGGGEGKRRQENTECGEGQEELQTSHRSGVYTLS